MLNAVLVEMKVWRIGLEKLRTIFRVRSILFIFQPIIGVLRMSLSNEWDADAVMEKRRSTSETDRLPIPSVRQIFRGGQIAVCGSVKRYCLLAKFFR